MRPRTDRHTQTRVTNIRFASYATQAKCNKQVVRHNINCFRYCAPGEQASIVTHRRSIAERGGCFQRRLFVCQFVCQHDNFRTTKRRKGETRRIHAIYKNLVRVRMSRSKVQGQGHRKKTKSVAFCSKVVLLGAARS